MNKCMGPLVLAGLLACGVPVQAGALQQVEELGLVRWERDHEAAFAKALEADKPLLLLFQEIPG